jgi:predicted ATP-dependent protease
MEKLAEFIGNLCVKRNIRHLDRGGMAKLVEYSMRLSGSQSKMATRFNELIEIVFEANAYAEMDEREIHR